MKVDNHEQSECMRNTELVLMRDEWLLANENAVNEAQTYLTKKGSFNPPLEKAWPKWEELRKIADTKWYAYCAAQKIMHEE